MDYILINPKSQEWDYMWGELATHPINDNIDQPTLATHNGESWQYMGSYKQGEKTIHSFRHRHHPKTEDRYYLNIYASKSFDTQEDISRKIKL